MLEPKLTPTFVCAKKLLIKYEFAHSQQVCIVVGTA